MWEGEGRFTPNLTSTKKKYFSLHYYYKKSMSRKKGMKYIGLLKQV